MLARLIAGFAFARALLWIAHAVAGLAFALTDAALLFRAIAKIGNIDVRERNFNKIIIRKTKILNCEIQFFSFIQ